jgi:hypothetical protein
MISDTGSIAMAKESGNENPGMPGWFKFHRALLNHEVFQDGELLRLYLLLLSRASFTNSSDRKKSGKGNRIFKTNIGQCVVGRRDLAESLKEPGTTCRDRLKKLEEYGLVTLHSANQYTTVTLMNYQSDEWVDPRETANQPPTTRLPTAKRPPTNRQSTVNQPPQTKNVKIVLEDKKEKTQTMERECVGDAELPPSVERILEIMDEYIHRLSNNENTGNGVLNQTQKQNLAREFFNYWETRGWLFKGKPILLSAEVNKWLQREISKHTATELPTLGEKVWGSTGI